MTHGDDLLDPFILTYGPIDDAVSVGDPTAATLESGEPDTLFGSSPITGSWWFKLPSDPSNRNVVFTLIGDGASAGQWQMRLFWSTGTVTGFGDLHEVGGGFDANNTADPQEWTQSGLDAGLDWWIQVGQPAGRTPGSSLAMAAVDPSYVPPSPDVTVNAPRAEATASGAPVRFRPAATTIYATRAGATAFPADAEVTTEDGGTVIRAFMAFAGVSCPDPVVSISHDFGADGRIHRWRLYDPATGDRWEFHHNPNQMASPNRPRAINIFVTPPLYNPAVEARGGMARIYESNIAPYEWGFSGWIRDEDTYNKLVAWTRKVNRVQLTDHFNRTWSIRFKEFDPDEQRPSHRSDWRFDYDIKATLYGALA